MSTFFPKHTHDWHFEEPTVGALTQVSQTPPVYSFDMNFAFTYTAKGAPVDPATTSTATTTTTATATQ